MAVVWSWRKIDSMKILCLFILTVLFAFPDSSATAQSANNFCPNYSFTRNLVKGSNSPDVLVLQKILNLDARTEVSKTGPGSVSKETRIFGENTRAALKRFQALFIEYTEVADGKFSGKTKDLVNNICQGPYFTGQSSQVFSINKNIDTNDKTGPQITITAPEKIDINETFRVTINANENIELPEINGIILEGGIASDIRKISPTSYSFSVKPDETNTSKQINIQIEADSITDSNGNKNETASNELILEVIGTVSSTSLDVSNLSTSTSSGLESLNSILSQLPSAVATDCGNKQVSVYDYSNPCYGRATMVNPASGNSTSAQKPSQNIITPMLTGLVAAYGLVKLTGGLGGLANLFGMSKESNISGITDVGGIGAFEGECRCKGTNLGVKTILLVGKTGPTGRFFKDLNPTFVGGPYTGKVLVAPPAGGCGNFMNPDGKTCNNILFDSTNTGPVIGIIPKSPLFMGTF
jgi:hypothetical protein